MARQSRSDETNGDKGPTPPPETDLPDRLRELDDRLARLRSDTEGSSGKSGGFMKEGAHYGRALKHVSEFVGGTMAGLLLGWLVDYVIGSFPVGLVVGLILGFVTGIWNIYKASLRVDGR